MNCRLTLATLALLAGCGSPPTNEATPDVERAGPTAQSPTAPMPAPHPEEPRRAGVLAALGDIDPSARAAIAFADIGGDAREEALVYLVDPALCGSGGCSLIVLTPSGKGWRDIVRTSVTQLPVHRLRTSRDGWNDLSVGIGGGGGPAGTAVLRFKSGRYPSNPSVQPILNRIPEGARLLIDDDAEVLKPVR